MHIAGGFYREQCCMPAWDAMFGSGGRAAAAISKLSPGSILHTYAEDFNSDGVAWLRKLGIEMQLCLRPTPIVFMYFHPLSRPHKYPSPNEIERQPQIIVNGDAVLRFGFLEGDAVVDADRAVYDPQTWRNPAPFGANGSRANELAIVLNELELKSATGKSDLTLAALQVIKDQNAEIVVVKRGIWGATVYERSGAVTPVPVYRSSRVFKIGTGDVFSAIFAHYWAEKKLPAAESADLASRSVAAYCNSGKLSIVKADTEGLNPIRCKESGTVLLLGTINSIGQRYTMEEARFVLKELGVNVFSPALDSDLNGTTDAVLILVEGADTKCIELIEYELQPEIPIVVLQEEGVQYDKLQNAQALKCARIVDDFTTALYVAAWAALEIDS